jgi:hypothetical protein
MVISMQSQISRERRLIILQASPHQHEVLLECGRACWLVLNLPYEFAQAASIHQSLENIIHETFVTESQKITALYGDLAKQSYKPFGGFAAKMTSTDR